MVKSQHNSCSDEELMILLTKGNTTAFDCLYERYASKLYFYFLRMLDKNPRQAEDALQDLFLKVVTSSGSFDTQKKFKTWLYCIAHNICKNHYRHQAVVAEYFLQKTDENTIEPYLSDQLLAKIDANLFREQLTLALDKLPAQKREAFLLRYQEDYTIAEIAHIQNCPEGSVKSRLYYALRLLEAELLLFKPVND